MQLVLSHPTGNEFVRAVAHGFNNQGWLKAFFTSVATFPGSILDNLSQFEPFAEFQRRRYETTLKPVVHTRPWLELGRQAAGKINLRKLVKHETGLFSVDAVYRDLDKVVAAFVRRNFASINAVYAYEDGAASTFSVAKQHGIKCIYDLPIGYWRCANRLLQDEREKWPQWACTLLNFGDSKQKLNRKDEEIQLADNIIVASNFTAATLKDFPGHLPAIKVIPYAFPRVANFREYIPFKNRKLKLLFVGGLSQRKGLANLFQVVDKVSNYVELTVIGKKLTDQCRPLDSGLAKHRWIPSASHEQVLKEMRSHDVLTFPSLFEGFGLVITESMSQGTPVITTDRTAGPDVIRGGENGWLIEAGSSEALMEAIDDVLTYPEKMVTYGRAAASFARQRQWNVYSTEVVQAVQQIGT